MKHFLGRWCWSACTSFAIHLRVYSLALTVQHLKSIFEYLILLKWPLFVAALFLHTSLRFFRQKLLSLKRWTIFDATLI
jgi:hypothetical protein